MVASRFSWLSRGTSLGSTSCHLYWKRIPPQETTDIRSSVRPKRRYFIALGHLDDKLQFLAMRNQPAFVSLAQEASYRLTPFAAVIQRPVVHVHPNEPVRQPVVHAAGELQRVLHCFSTMV